MTRLRQPIRGLLGLADVLIRLRVGSREGGAQPAARRVGSSQQADNTLQVAATLLPSHHSACLSAIADSLTWVFAFAVPLLVLAFVLTWFLKEPALNDAA
jgi:hypothetical protein